MNHKAPETYASAGVNQPDCASKSPREPATQRFMKASNILDQAINQMDNLVSAISTGKGNIPMSESDPEKPVEAASPTLKETLENVPNNMIVQAERLSGLVIQLKDILY